MHLALLILAWLIALIWLARAIGAAIGMPTVPNLLDAKYSVDPVAATLTVIVPARNEQENVRACLNSLLVQQIEGLQIIAVNDRSEDATGEIMDELSLLNPDKLRTLHITSLPPDWLGKTHAMAKAASTCETDFLLFTDADVIFAPDALRRALSYAESSIADHLVLVPTTIIRRWDEAALLSFFSIFALWSARAWKVSDPKAKRDVLGIGAFNMIRRTAYDSVGGFSALPMEIVEDLGIARRIKRAGLRQRAAFGRGLVSVHWASGVPGLVNVMTKNVFAAVNFRVPLLLGGCAWLFAFCILPFVGFFIPGFTAPCAIAIISIGSCYILMSFPSGLSAWNVALAPFAAATFIFTLLRSMATTLRQGGVVWRGTFYPLATLRKHAPPLF